MQPRRTGTTKAGAPCRAPAMSGAAYCVTHDPARVVELAEWRRRGGKGKSSAARAKKGLPAGVLSSEELRGVVGITIKRVLTGATEPAVGNAIATLAKAYVVVTEATALADEIAAIKEAVGLEGERTA